MMRPMLDDVDRSVAAWVAAAKGRELDVPFEPGLASRQGLALLGSSSVGMRGDEWSQHRQHRHP